MQEAWFSKIIEQGLSSLISLRLEGAPAADAMHATANIWSKALWKGRVWNEQADKERIGEAFRQLAISCSRWPSPSAFLEYLPMRGTAPAQTVPVPRQLADKTGERPDAEHRARMLARFNQRMAEYIKSPERIAQMEQERKGFEYKGKMVRIPWTDADIYDEWKPCNSVAEILARLGAKV